MRQTITLVVGRLTGRTHRPDHTQRACVEFFASISLNEFVFSSGISSPDGALTLRRWIRSIAALATRRSETNRSRSRDWSDGRSRRNPRRRTGHAWLAVVTRYATHRPLPVGDRDAPCAFAVVNLPRTSKLGRFHLCEFYVRRFVTAALSRFQPVCCIDRGRN